ncbi:hypothetical protein OPV22_017038 [Ensete ventricosum]|uniref:Uncharacterized protein n=1 Tax=Ensete ventricosum TaxID=4639 RepID=A0AAV8QVE3_ENSVE|nr:hypothetical protein OPV22_017038 [Ensete ventricosum]
MGSIRSYRSISCSWTLGSLPLQGFRMRMSLTLGGVCSRCGSIDTNANLRIFGLTFGDHHSTRGISFSTGLFQSKACVSHASPCDFKKFKSCLLVELIKRIPTIKRLQAHQSTQPVEYHQRSCKKVPDVTFSHWNFIDSCFR